MALELSVEAQAFLQQNNISGNIILELDGFDTLYGSVLVSRVAQIGSDFVIGDGTLIGGVIYDESSKGYISLTGTTNNIAVKLDQDKGGSSSITSFKIRLIDKNGELTNLFSPSVTVSDMLGLEATVYWQAVGSRHPQDSARLFVGVCSSCNFGQGFVDLRIDHPEQLKRQDLLPVQSGTLNGAIDSSTTTIAINEALDFPTLTDDTSFSMYARIDDEIIYHEGLSGGVLQNVVRAQLGTVASSHDDDAEINSFYRVQGSAIDLSLKIMLSDPSRGYFATYLPSYFGEIDGVGNSILFDHPDIMGHLGLTIGDYVLMVGIPLRGSGTEPTQAPIISSGVNSAGKSYITLGLTGTGYAIVNNGRVVLPTRFKSKYNTLPFGCGLKPYHVDVDNFEYLNDTYSAQFFEYDFYIEDTINAKSFIDEQLLFPSSLFSLPRKGRISAGISAPPIVGPRTKTISSQNVTNAASLVLSRSINQYFYNSVVYKFNNDTLETDRYLSAIVTLNQNSTNRIPIGARTMTIECGGIRNTALNRNKITAITDRLFDRYQYGAESLSVEVNFKTGFEVEVGDTVILDGESLGLSDITNASKQFIPRVMEVTDKEINLKTAKVKLALTDTNLGALVRYGVIANASFLGASSTTTSLFLKQSYRSVVDGTPEKEKWKDYVGQLVRVRSEDFTYDETVTVLSVTNSGRMNISPELSFTPQDNYIVECPQYDESNAQIMKLYKAVNCFINKQDDQVLSGATSYFLTDQPEIYQRDCAVRIHLPDFSEDHQTTVGSITLTNRINLDDDAPFTITSSHVVDLIGFADNIKSYVYY